MKKYFLNVMAMAVCALTTVSCSKSSDPYTPGQSDIDVYNMRFLSYVGGTISDNQDWGFGASSQSKSSTRGAENGYYIADNSDKLYAQAYFKQALDSLP